LTRLFAVLIAAAVLAPAAPAHASGTEALKTFLQQTQSARANFTQTVLDKSRRKLQEVSGVMQFVRPGKFRWDYEKPYEQLLIGDGVKLWVYDKDLNQVTVKNLSQVLGASPAALLAGSNDIEKNFSLSSIGTQEGLDWLEAVPKAQDSTFQRVRLGFGKAGLEAMELHDSFGQVTLMRFSNIERNPKLSADLFKFTPPKGADVISD
jgi:outer membrane lipoprotein carrier protein